MDAAVRSLLYSLACCLQYSLFLCKIKSETLKQISKIITGTGLLQIRMLSNTLTTFKIYQVTLHSRPNNKGNGRLFKIVKNMPIG
jgi:hypothetical protein